MGCCIRSASSQAGYREQRVKERNDALQAGFKQNAPEPYITATGQITVPITIMTGEWSDKYPVWIADWGVTQEEYSYIIQTLTNATRPLAQSMYDAQAKAAGDAYTRNPLKMQQKQLGAMSTVMSGAANFQKIPQAIESTLYTLNQQVFGPKGLQALSSTSGSVGIVIFKKGNAPQAQANNMAQMGGMQMNPQQQAMIQQQMQQINPKQMAMMQQQMQQQIISFIV
eukprot:35662_1